ncbi:multidrug efflux transporter AcrB transmembrane domain-containing protein [Gymnopilus junonius]|uniref:Multidrug efflux transporter AcrB transmembrane domain-containing protein n=1 Tax=Gymnopilus junonius TaxID=109634 RepID=A0A9P5NQZ4_GYMJU|nr:multidrug efflux transporter AcrB transmembrane domain-containing protein [Gymnopilus junonius]
MNIVSPNGKCAMRGSCGKKGFFGKPLPCPYDGPPVDLDDKSRSLIQDVCGPELVDGPTCCTSDQLETLRANFDQVEPLLSACPACRNNFRTFFCTFTCSPNQDSFLNITSTQRTSTGQTAVKSLDFYVKEDYGKGFFDSCKNVQSSNTNGYVMDLIGGGAKDYESFFRFLGEEKDLGSPFQINFPLVPPPDITPLNMTPRSCADDDLASRCTCIDCPDVCPAIPPVLPPNESTCHVGGLSCLSFILVVTYSLVVFGLSIGYIIRTTLQKRRERSYERVALSNIEEDSLGIQSESRRLGRGASLLDPIDTVQPRQYPLNNILRRGFYKLGLFTATSPWLTFTIVFAVMGSLNLGWKRFEVETDPVRLWVGPSSESKLQKEFFDSKFGPFYRTEQIFITSSENQLQGLNNFTLPGQSRLTTGKKPVLSWDHLKYWFNEESKIRALKSEDGHTLRDVCFKPAGPRGACVVQSVAAWFGNDLDDYDEETWAPHLQSCASSPVDCLPDFQQPLAPEYVLGGVPTTNTGKKVYLDAEALVITYVVDNSLDLEKQAVAMKWEETLKDYLYDLSQRSGPEAGLEIAFSTGISLEEEINKSTNLDVRIVVLSYLAMFFYVSLTLGSGSASSDEDGIISSLAEWVHNFPRLFARTSSNASTVSIDSRTTPRLFPRLPRSLFVGSKFTLGLFAILLVILSVSTSVGLFSFLGVKVTLIIAEVIPFLVLAVGVDNVFILVHELDRQNFLHGPNAASQNYQNPAFSASMSPTHSHRSPFDSTQEEVDAASMPLFLPPEERVARTLAKMGPSILLSTITETVAFALGALVTMPAVRNFALYAAGSVLLNAALQVTVFVSALALDLRRYEANRVDCVPCIRLPSRIALSDGPNTVNGLGRIGRFIRRYYAPFLLRPLVKATVLIVFSGIFVASVISMQHIQLGLDQRLALPSDSYLVDYFDDLDAYFDVGPPVYFVSKDVDVTQRAGQQALCGRFSTCNDLSIANRLEAERKRPESSFISEPTASWIDDFLRWLNPSNDLCCRVRKADPSVFCGPRDSPRLCKPCYEGKEPAWNITMAGLPENEEFMRYFERWWASPTNEDCPLAGKASFGTAIALDEQGTRIDASHFRTFHAPLKSQEDFINAFAAAHRIAEDISQDIGAPVFPYSYFYVFFDQYAHIIAITQEILGLGLAAVLVVTALLLGSWRTGSIVTSVVALTVVTVMGAMSVWGISLNAISLVNLVISLGIAVEFCAHVARAFMSAGTGASIDHPSAQKERDERMWTALVDVGPSVLSGITFTKLIGMSVLALTRSKLLEIYYFRMWLTLIISGALHGLVLLPVVLSLAGGPGFPQQEADEEWMSNAIRNDYEYAPFLADDDSIASD